jgi:hypothetical protein
MKIKFLHTCRAPQYYTETHCSCCGPERYGPEDTLFFEDQEEDPDVYGSEIILKDLKYKEDYEITEYP